MRAVGMLDQLSCEERLNLIARHAEALVLLSFTPDGRIVDWSAGARTMFGWTAEEIAGKSILTLFTPEDVSANVPTREMERAQASGRATDTRWLVRKDGSRIFVDGEVNALRMADGSLAGFVKTLHDATAFHHAWQSEAVLRAMVNATPHMVWSADAGGMGEYYNEKMLVFTGKPFAALLGTGWAELVHPDDRDATRQAWRAAITAKAPISIEFRFRHHSGQYRWVLCRGEPVFDQVTGEIERWMGTNTDIHDQKEADAALRDARQRLEATLSAGNIGTWNWNLETDLLYADSHMSRLFGVDAQAGAGLAPERFFTAVHPDDVENVRCRLRQAVGETGDFSATYRLVLADGGIRHVHARGKVEYAEDGRPAWLPGVVMDLTELRASQEILRVREERYRTLFDSIEEGFAIIELVFDEHGNAVDHRYLEANAALEAITQTVAIGGKLASEVYPDHAPAWRAMYLEVLKTGKPIEREVEVARWGRWISFSIARIGPESAQQVAIFVRDITRKKQYEDDLRRREERYRALFNAIEEGFTIIELIDDADGQACDYRFLEVNPALTRITGLKDVLGKTLREVVAAPNLEWIARYAEVARTGEPAQWTDYSKALDGWFDLSVVRIGEAGSRQVALLFADVSERRRNDEALRQLAEDLAQANRRQREFLATLAHELRNPLAPIRAGLDVLRLASRNPDKVEKMREVMSRQVNHLVHLVDDLLDLARVTSGKIVLRKSLVRLDDIVHQAVESVTPLMQSRQHDFRIDLTSEAVWLTADVNRLVQIVVNLLTNAAKYTPERGWVELRTRREGEQAVVTVSDNGIGIPGSSLPHLFEMFSQVAEASELSAGGLGIGLNLVKRLAEKHGGTVEVASAGAGQGATFTLRLPVAPVAPGVDLPR